ncbi:hypothetical protein CROQUDRAFT_661916 [Cronartium quercuum f. sp. fusiforme G11]|uniref:Uncharacterized protein n=1 Tax=Cronartium quercuum f. sp. fusiforme G11 TaxID=708437 RepID=A0A9P6NFT0_9BASI|nr:hypothetical protein CROQUDRAFT_661916 [Cronartium quercuum f. sp. fusiforme G11]
MLTKPTTKDVTFFNTLSLESDELHQLIQIEFPDPIKFYLIASILTTNTHKSLHSTDGPTHHHHPQKDTVSIKGVVEVYLRRASGTEAQNWCGVQCTTSVETLEGVPPKLH